MDSTSGPWEVMEAERKVIQDGLRWATSSACVQEAPRPYEAMGWARSPTGSSWSLGRAVLVLMAQQTAQESPVPVKVDVNKPQV